MCGINGILGLQEAGQARERIDKMNNTLQHRGPDDAGFFVEECIALGHRRLSIIDLSSAGHQPMLSHDGRYVLVFNGEIYNYRELKKQLDYPYRTGTDTEVILAAYAKWGEGCLEHMNGMFAFALYDRETKTVFIARDRLGIKPLYFYSGQGLLSFSSELRPLLQSGLVPKKAERRALVDYLRYQTVHAPDTIVEGVKMLMPGTFLRIGLTAGKPEWSIHRWWKAEAQQYQLNGTPAAEIHQEIRKRMYEAVECRLVADVPFGAFLSGGIDSSLVVGIMAEVSSRPVHTFNISFAEEQFSEARYARQIAEKFKTEHKEIKLSPADFLGLLPAALQAMDHPSGDGPNTYVVSKATKEVGISMALTGLGGDELFAGYAVFRRMQRLERLKGLWKLPVGVRKLAGETLYKMKPGIAAGKIRAALAAPAFSFGSNFACTRRVFLEEQVQQLLAGAQLPADALTASLEAEGVNNDILSATSRAEIGSYMQNVLLRDSDQMSMAHALELRVPFLDYRLVEYVLAVPDKIKYPHTKKKLLIDSLPHLLPDNIVNRPKMGFEFPWAHWLKGELHDLADHQLQQLATGGVFKEEGIARLWQQFKQGDPNVSYSRIWPLVVLSHWLEQNEVEL
ncbi:asparagine synthase (glutamine-hydrolyzing) [Nafulsella turpanensis]|uniref:asparagine synthase (glutamine-hydrolyzing) n=1 Tax=Nafulsella turpanensis TaxID=1265690 RepID=UPI0003467DEB|nr:asparagine synthase (glutamine-hydrolyzing) [Nafulsella turpanensis]